jgi:hypothetical protein
MLFFCKFTQSWRKHLFSVWHWVRQEVGFCLTHGLCFIFLTEIKNVGKPETDIDEKYSERDRTIRYCLIFLDNNMYTEKHLMELFNDHDYI